MTTWPLEYSFGSMLRVSFLFQGESLPQPKVCILQPGKGIWLYPPCPNMMHHASLWGWCSQSDEQCWDSSKLSAVCQGQKFPCIHICKYILYRLFGLFEWTYCPLVIVVQWLVCVDSWSCGSHSPCLSPVNTQILMLASDKIAMVSATPSCSLSSIAVAPKSYNI